MNVGWVDLIEEWALSLRHEDREHASSQPVYAGECGVTDLQTERLTAAELALAPRGAASTRIKTYTMGRLAARRALEAMNGASEPVTSGNSGEPIWPSDVLGSISHTSNLGIALVGDARRIGGIGVDVERRGSASEVGRLVAFEEELDRVRGPAATFDEDALVELFAVKEAVFKAFFPRVRVFFGFDSVRVSPGDDAGTHVCRFVDELDSVYGSNIDFEVNTRWIGDFVFSWLVLGKPEDD